MVVDVACNIPDNYYCSMTPEFHIPFIFEKTFMLFETKHEPLAPVHIYRKRILRSLSFGAVIMFFCILLGTGGYHFTAHIRWIDSFHNACLILSGMGPVIEISTTSGKLFSSFYALFSGVVFISTIGIILAPAIHRFFHRLHVETGKDK